MPTGYTADIAKGITFRQFAMNCARAFGALVTLRDEPNAPIPNKFEPSDYHVKKLESLLGELKIIEEISDKEADKRALKEFEEAEENRIKRIQELHELRSKYEAMLSKAKAWTPPTSEHQGLKDFMIEQITGSINFDCGTEYYEIPTIKKTSSAWKEEKLKEIQKDIDYHRREHLEEVKRAQNRTDWVNDLRNSV